MAFFHCIMVGCKKDWEGPMLAFMRTGYKCPACGLPMCPGQSSDFDEHGNRKPKPRDAK